MTDPQKLFDEAYEDCLKDCFKTLGTNLNDGQQPPPEERFKDCCETCRKAREIARQQGGAAPAGASARMSMAPARGKKKARR